MTNTLYKTDYDEAVDILSEVFHYDEDADTAHESEILDDSDFEWHTGASKVVIVLEDCVLKTSYSGISWYNEETCEYEMTEEFSDYAKMEYQLYQAAKDVGVDYFFAETEEVTPVIYKQEKVDFTVSNYMDEENIPAGYKFHGAYSIQPSPPQFVLNCEGLHNYCRKNGLKDLVGRIKPDVLGYFLATYSQEKLENLQIFLKEYDINDIRAGNCGWIKGELKIFDFCGFKTETEKILSE